MAMNDPRYSEIHIEQLPPLHVVSCRAVSGTPEEDVTRQVAAWRTAKGLPGTLRTFGFDVEVAPEQAAAGLRGYELWVAAPRDVELDEEMQVKEFRGGLYAVMTIFDAFDDPFASIPQGWGYLHEWVTNHAQYEGAEHQMLEEVVVEADAGDGALRRHLSIYYPLAAIAVGVPA
jgi:DNA gyrase inhibitor GyrI